MPFTWELRWEMYVIHLKLNMPEEPMPAEDFRLE
jgi:hypothetical protein